MVLYELLITLSCWIIVGYDTLCIVAWQSTAVSFAVPPGTKPQLGGSARQRCLARWLQQEVIPGCFLCGNPTYSASVECGMGIYHAPASAFIHCSLPHTPNAGRAGTWQFALPGMEEQERGCGAAPVSAVVLTHAGITGGTSGFLKSRGHRWQCAAGPGWGDSQAGHDVSWVRKGSLGNVGRRCHSTWEGVYNYPLSLCLPSITLFCEVLILFISGRLHQ